MIPATHTHRHQHKLKDLHIAERGTAFWNCDVLKLSCHGASPHSPLDVPTSVIKYTNGTIAFRNSLHRTVDCLCSLVSTFGSKSVSEFHFLFNRALGVAHHISAKIRIFHLLLPCLFCSLLCGKQCRMMVFIDINIIWISLCAELNIL
jgi:hypothetical protein